MIESVSKLASWGMSPGMIIIIGVGLALFLPLLIVRLIPSFKHHMVNRRIRSQVKKLGGETLSNIRVPDDVDGELFIDHLVLSGNRVIVVHVKRYDGLIYGSEMLETWTQVVNQRSFQFPNPLYQLKHHVMAVQSIVPGLEVEGKVLFAGQSRFPKRVPEGVLSLRDISRHSSQQAVSSEVLSGWKRLQAYQRQG